MNIVPDRVYFFDILNNIFHGIEDQQLFYDRCVIKPNENVLDFILKYYIYMNSQSIAPIPFRIYSKFVSGIPLISNINGHIYVCQSCHFCVVFSRTARKNHGYSQLQWFFIPSNWNSYLTLYVQQYGKEKTITSNYMTILFNHYHSHQSTRCNEVHYNGQSNIGIYDAFDVHYTRILRKLHLLELQLKINPYNDKKNQTYNYLYYIFRRININNYQPSSFEINQIIGYMEKYLEYTVKPNYTTVLAGFTFLALNQLLSKRVLSDYLEIKHHRNMRYPNISERMIGNIFGIHITTLQHIINTIAKKIILIPSFFDQ